MMTAVGTARRMLALRNSEGIFKNKVSPFFIRCRQLCALTLVHSHGQHKGKRSPSKTMGLRALECSLRSPKAKQARMRSSYNDDNIMLTLGVRSQIKCQPEHRFVRARILHLSSDRSVHVAIELSRLYQVALAQHAVHSFVETCTPTTFQLRVVFRTSLASFPFKERIFKAKSMKILSSWETSTPAIRPFLQLCFFSVSSGPRSR